jgi:hypothetical protein
VLLITLSLLSLTLTYSSNCHAHLASISTHSHTHYRSSFFLIGVGLVHVFSVFLHISVCHSPLFTCHTHAGHLMLSHWYVKISTGTEIDLSESVAFDSDCCIVLCIGIRSMLHICTEGDTPTNGES